MKKFICVLVFLAMVNMASAGIVDLSITSLNGVDITPTKTIEIYPTDVLDFRFTFTAPNTEYLFGISATVNVSGNATLDWSQFIPRIWDEDNEIWLIGPDMDVAYDPSLHWRGGTDPDSGDSIVEGAVGKGKKGTGLEVWVLKNILLHCDAPGQVLVYLTDFPLGGGTRVYDTNYEPVPWEYGPGLVITQLIPEPMTLTLLGLGGLFLARRKK